MHWWSRAGHAHESAAIAATAAHLEHQIAGAKVGHELKGRESEAALVAQGVLKAGTQCVYVSVSVCVAVGGRWQC